MNQDSACACPVPIIRWLHQQARDDASELMRVSYQTASEDAEISRFEIPNECLRICVMNKETMKFFGIRNFQ